MPRHIHLNSRFKHSHRRKSRDFPVFQLWSDRATRCRPAGLDGCVYYRQACWCRVLNWSVLADLSALLQLHCSSWMFHAKVGWFWALPGWVCCLTETHLLWGRVEVKNSRHDKQRTPGTTSDVHAPPHPPTHPAAHRRQASVSDQRGVQLCTQIPTFGFVPHSDMCCSHLFFSPQAAFLWQWRVI